MTAHYPAPHNPTPWRYQQGCRHPDCRKVAAEAVQASRALAVARAAGNPALIPHGTISGYQYWHCRLPCCVEAERMAKATWRALRKRRDGIPLTDFDREVLADAAVSA